MNMHVHYVRWGLCAARVYAMIETTTKGEAMKSRVIFTVIHDETTDELEAFIESADYLAISTFDECSYDVEVDVE